MARVFKGQPFHTSAPVWSRDYHMTCVLGTACGSLLQRPWKAAESTQLKTSALTFLLKHHIEWASDSLLVVENLAGDASVELIGEEGVEQSTKYPTLTR